MLSVVDAAILMVSLMSNIPCKSNCSKPGSLVTVSLDVLGQEASFTCIIYLTDIVQLNDCLLARYAPSSSPKYQAMQDKEQMIQDVPFVVPSIVLHVLRQLNAPIHGSLDLLQRRLVCLDETVSIADMAVVIGNGLTDLHVIL